jgi:hypothetical protein
MSRGLFGCCAVVDDEYLAHRMKAQHDLIKLRIVVDRVCVIPIFVRPSAGSGVIQVEQFGVLGDISVVRLG